MIHLETVLTQGRTRTIYEHPTDQGWVIKVLKRHTYATGGKLSLVIRSTLHSFFPSLSDNLRDLRNYKKLSADLKLYIPEYRPTLIQTDKGPGLASQKVLDDNGQPSQTLLNYLQDNKRLSNELKHLSEQFFDTLLKKQLYFFDFNQNNFLIQRKNGKEYLKFIDLKGYRKDRSILPLTHLFPTLAEKKMKRRIQRFYERIAEQR